MKHLKQFNEFLNESLSSSDKKIMKDFFNKATGKVCKIVSDDLEEEGVLQNDEGLYKVEGGDLYLELDYLLSTDDVKISSHTESKLEWVWGDSFSLEIIE